MKEKTKCSIKNNNGITLIALVVTIIVLIILAGISINLVLRENGIITRAKEASKAQEIAEIKEQIQMEIASKETEKLSNSEELTKYELEIALNKYGNINYEDDGKTIKSITTEKGYEILLTEIWKGTVEEDGVTILADGSWNGILHTPKIKNTGLTAVYWNGTTWKELNSQSTEEEWANWYNYADTSKTGAGTSNWANARSKDGSMWVWIPRYEYKIDTENKTIDVNFIEIGKETTTGYILHPAFGTDIDNGGWSSDLPGFWVAKYEAGFQNATVGEETKTVEYSNLKYTTVNTNYTTNYFGAITANTTSLSYPVFKANTYSYNIISVADAWLLSQEIDTASMYGLSNVDSHMLKNSEWGAVAYLTHSKYGVNGNSSAMNEVTINSKNLNDTTKNIYAITSYGNSNTANDVNASSTKNMTGVFDLNGGAWERVSGFKQGGAANTTDWHKEMASSSTTSSSKYLTLYTDDNKIGDATNETSGWNSDYFTSTTSSSPIFSRGGYYDDGDYSGVFAFNNGSGTAYSFNGFRVCLAF